MAKRAIRAHLRLLQLQHRGSKRQVNRCLRHPAGARVLCEWNGRTHASSVPTMVLFDGKPSVLSAIARRITGAHWSGPRFFGL